ncbi:hypothetical protein [uncultured Dokdonia sp.]|uniref:hypothetical protein n=1 Tax=uncultured Dokdonia sp. TaxID=575653 RepID=UPI00263699B1|nr:hypothetical protein [uncultured Dokdonia sp.]
MRNSILIIILLSLFSCNEKKSSKNKVIEQNEVTNKIDVSNINKENNSNFIIITHDYNYEKDYYRINLNEYNLKGNKLKSNKRNLSFGKYKDVLMGGKYNTSGAYYPVQFDNNQNKMYMSIYRADEIEGTFDYSKILEYNLKNDSIREIISFSDYFNSWYLSASNKKIFGFDNSIKSLISVELNNSKVDTLYTSNSSFEEIEYHLNKDKSLDVITFDRESGLTKFNVDISTNKTFKTTLQPLTSFSSYRKGVILQTYKDFTNNIEELRIYKNSKKKSIPFDFKNFNTYWINDFEFIVIKKDEIQKINTDLEIIDSFSHNKIHVIDVISDLIFVSYYENNDKKISTLNFDFENLVEIPNIKPEEIVSIIENN